MFFSRPLSALENRNRISSFFRQKIIFSRSKSIATPNLTLIIAVQSAPLIKKGMVSAGARIAPIISSDFPKINCSLAVTNDLKRHVNISIEIVNAKRTKQRLTNSYSSGVIFDPNITGEKWAINSPPIRPIADRMIKILQNSPLSFSTFSS